MDRAVAELDQGPVSSPPDDLTVERFDRGGDQFAVVSWPVAPRVQRSLTPALSHVLAGILEGRTNAAIAAGRGTSVRTVANQVAALLRIYQVSSRFELALAESGRRRQP